MCTNTLPAQPAPRDGYIAVGRAALYWREIGQGQPIIIVHGGPDFNHGYLLPDMDRLSDTFRLIYFDLRGRGKSAHNVQPEDVSIQSDVEDLDKVRDHFRLDKAAVLGHSWGGVVAMEYAVRHPKRVSHLILMNSAAASHADYLLFRQELLRRTPADSEEKRLLSARDQYKAGDPQTVSEYYRVHFRATLRQPELLDRLIESLRTSSSREGILKAWAIEDRLMNQTQLASGYDLLPKLKQLRLPALVIHGEHDLVPLECSAHIAQAVPGARLVVLKDCGHFPYIECPDALRQLLMDFFYRRYEGAA